MLIHPTKHSVASQSQKAALKRKLVQFRGARGDERGAGRLQRALRGKKTGKETIVVK